MKIAITGANGFIGINLLKHLSTSSHNVNAIVRKKNHNIILSKNIKYTIFDYKDSNSQTYSLLGKPDILIHLAWNNLDNYDSASHLNEELETSYNFLEFMINSGIKNILIAGTCFEYGMEEGLLSETKKTNPKNNYSESKNILRKRLQEIKRIKNFKFTWMRIFYIYGNGQNKKTIYSLLSEAIKRGDIKFNMSLGNQTRDYLHIKEVVKKISTLAQINNDNGIVNICSGKGKPIKLIVKEWIKYNNWKIDLNLGHYPYNKNEPMHFWGNNEKYKELTKK